MDCDINPESQVVQKDQPGLGRKIITETWNATFMLLKFMAIAFFINALIRFYLPQEFIVQLLGQGNPGSVLRAALIGIPVYTSNLTAMPLVGELLDLGMSKGAALAFLMAGPTTTLPAMSAVWGLVNRRIFLLYIFSALLGAIAIGYVYVIIA
jgi:uncharacterized membrane protein YraQ (UPF0718 family)